MFACLFCVLTAGCAEVNPETDYVSAATQIKNRLSIGEAYQPGVEILISQKIDGLLEGGLTADEAVSLALLNNTSFQSRFQSIGVARADVVQAGLWTNPSLLIGNRFIEGGGRSELTFGFAQQLVDLWQIPVKKNIAEAQLRQTVLDVLNEAVQIATTVRSQYYDTLWRESLDRIAQDNLALARRSLNLAEIRLDAGETSPLDAGLVKTQVLAAENVAITARRDLENARLALRLSLGLAQSDRSIRISDRFENPSEISKDTDVLVDLALCNRYDFQISDALVEAAGQDVDLQLTKIFPSMAIGFQGERTEQRALPGRKILADTARSSVGAGQLTAPSIQSRGQRDIARSQIIDALFGASIQLTLPIWDQNQAQIAKAGFVYQQRLRDRDFLGQAIVTDVRSAANNLRTARDSYALFISKILPQAETNINTAESRYKNGEDSILILLETQDNMFVQKKQAADALRELLIAHAELVRACGGNLTEQPEERDRANYSGNNQMKTGDE